MGKRQKWKRVHVLLQFTSVVVGCVINEKIVLELHVLEYCLNSTRAHEARVLSQYLIPLFHASVPRWIEKNGTRARLLYCLETMFQDKIFLKLMVMGHFARGLWTSVLTAYLILGPKYLTFGP